MKLVNAVKLYLDVNPDHRLTPGLPADAMTLERECGVSEAALVADTPLLRVSGFATRYGKREAVRGIDIAVRRGEVFGLISPTAAARVV